MAFEVINGFLLRHERLDIFSLHLVKTFLNVARYDLNDWQDGAMAVGTEWAIDHYLWSVLTTPNRKGRLLCEMIN